MNKNLAAFCRSYGLTVEGDCASGTIKGYDTSIVWRRFDTVSPVRLCIGFYASEDQKRAVETAVRKLAIPYSQVTVSAYGIVLGLNDALTLGRLLKRMPSIIDGVYAILESQQLRGSEFCPVCGEPLQAKESRRFNADGASILMHAECAGDINKIIENENADFENAPKNYLRGFAGAVIGALGGVVFAVILYLVGFVSALSAVISMALGTLLYKKFGGRPDKMMIVIVTLTTLVLMEASVLIIYVVAAGMASAEANAMMSAWEAFIFLMSDSEFSGMFIADMLLTLLFSALGAGFQVYALSKQIKRKDKIK